MKALILAAGYATRLFPLTLNRAKPLLPIQGKPIIDYIVENIIKVPEIDEIYVVTNNKYYKDFCKWQEQSNFSKKITPINDGTLSDSDKLGAIGDIDLVIKKMNIDSDLLIVAGDNLFRFEMTDFVDFFKKNGLSLACYKYPHKEELFNYGIVELADNMIVKDFKEKPKNPKSDLVALCLYAFPASKINLIKDYLSQNENQDAPGFYLQWLCKKDKIHAFVFDSTWHDIGTPEAYKRAEEEF